MKVAIMQPYLFPYLGYFQLVDAVDSFVFYDDVNFIKQGWINNIAPTFERISLELGAGELTLTEVDALTDALVTEQTEAGTEEEPLAVDALAAADRLHHGDAQRRLGLRGQAAAHVQRDGVLPYLLDGAGVVLSVAVEQHHVVADRYPQHASQVVRLTALEPRGAAGLQGLVAVETMDAHDDTETGKARWYHSLSSAAL